MKKMTVDGYEMQNVAIMEVIDKLTEADGSSSSALSYLADASRLLAFAIAEISAEEAEERLQAE